AVIEGKDESEFYAFLKDVLIESGHFTGLETEFDSGGKPTIMIGKLKGESVGVCCKKLPENLKVGADALTEFIELCEGRGLEAGVYITNTELDYSARDYLLQLKSFNLYIADIETLYSTFLSKGCLFSLEEVKRELEGKILYQSKKRDDTLRRILAVRRIWVYLSLGLIITLYSRATPYSRYYLFIAAVLFSLSLTAVARWRIEKFKEAVEEEIKLEKAL
ncbi:MAG: restriction endonuclease, partial [Thermodesulfovibrionales bacterium]|nr:restriction endonuclease [Thermodesulfovibrionales bacterium]